MAEQTLGESVCGISEVEDSMVMILKHVEEGVCPCKEQGNNSLAISAVSFLRHGKMRKVTDSRNRIVEAERYWGVLSEYMGPHFLQ